ncbi:SVSP family protein [Theileria parva strain Muguga]|uniref:Uncharacterized protein n=1 Tax=Theileria parva TaxID=5875 RepID=Q4N3G7_THEPA|nr:SVSP family protein [Theileria parva strain Muguga]EAN31368.1 SVSP family protein [Theileria parva strain Muguga]|eukprot:XP_763651.1 hypothetical protein [Theileria parva strain Muguga]
MNLCTTYIWLVIFTKDKFVQCADKQNTPGGGDKEGDGDTVDEGDNFNVTEVAGHLQGHNYHSHSTVYPSGYYNPGYPIYHYGQGYQYTYSPRFYHPYQQGYQGPPQFQYQYGLNQPRYYHPGSQQIGHGNSSEYSNSGPTYPHPNQKSNQDKVPSEPTEMKKPKHSYKHNRPTKSTKPTEPVKELVPEVVKLELDSDEEEDTQTTRDGEKEQLVGDKPKDEPTQKTDESGDVDKQNAKGGKEKKTIKFPKMIFMKKNSVGQLVEMTEGDYKEIFDDFNMKKYTLHASLEMVLCDYQVVFEHIAGKPYCNELCYYGFKNVFIIRGNDRFFFIKCVDGVWKTKFHNVPRDIKIYSQGSEGNYVQISTENINIDLTLSESIRFNVEGLKCVRVKNKDEVVWEKESDEEYPILICYTTKKRFLVYFKDCRKVFEKTSKKYTQKCIRKSRNIPNDS